MAKHFKALKPKSGKVTNIELPPNYDLMPPIFSLEKVVPSVYCFSALNKEHKLAFAESIFKRRTLTWRELKSLDKHGLGYEKIARGSIRTGIPATIATDLENFLAFRYHTKSPMVGYRDKQVFYILWFDHDFSVYNHG